MKHTVYIVHCVDTEGPLYEASEVPFSMLKSIFDIKIEPTKENLIKLQNKEIDLGGREEAVANLLAPDKIKTCGTWDQIDEMLNQITTEEFRNRVRDSAGNGWCYNWFCMDHAGFTGLNPRRRDAGYHNIYDHYRQLEKTQNGRDLIQFHYHPIPFSGNYNDSGTRFFGNNITEILARKVIERGWFPAVFRPGFHTERSDSNWFLEQWIPFDYANQAVKGLDTDQPDLANGRFGDWRQATKEWEVYHPDHDDYQISGNCRRWIARCLNMNARLREITLQDVREAFERAAHTGDTLLSFTDHDYKNMTHDIEKLQDMISKVSREYPEVNFIYSDAIEGMRKVLSLVPKPLNLEYKYKEINKNTAKITVTANEELFGPQPFLAIKTREGNYYWDNFDFQEKHVWTYTLDNNTCRPKSVEKIGIAANSNAGLTEVLLYDVDTREEVRSVWHS